MQALCSNAAEHIIRPPARLRLLLLAQRRGTATELEMAKPMLGAAAAPYAMPPSEEQRGRVDSVGRYELRARRT